MRGSVRSINQMFGMGAGENTVTMFRWDGCRSGGGLQMHRATVISRVWWPATAVPRLAVCSLLLWATLCKLTIHRSSASVPAASPCRSAMLQC